MDWPQYLRDWRGRHGMTQAALADALGCSKRAVEDWEQARRTPPPFLALALDQLAARPKA